MESEPLTIEGQSSWDFCCKWYSVEEIEATIQRGLKRHIDGYIDNPVPTNVASHEFAEWMTHQYRLAMNKGMELASREYETRLQARDKYVQHLPGCLLGKTTRSYWCPCCDIEPQNTDSVYAITDICRKCRTHNLWTGFTSHKVCDCGLDNLDQHAAATEGEGRKG